MQKTKRKIRIVSGYILFGIGVIGVFAPILPGWPLMIPGLILVGHDSKLYIWVAARLPEKLRQKLNAADAKQRPTPPE